MIPNALFLTLIVALLACRTPSQSQLVEEKKLTEEQRNNLLKKQFRDFSCPYLTVTFGLLSRCGFRSAQSLRLPVCSVAAVSGLLSPYGFRSFQVLLAECMTLCCS